MPRFGTAMMVASGLAPDLDYASYIGGAGAFMRFHRTALHSIIGAALLSCAIAAAFCALDRRIPAPKTAQKKTLGPLAFRAALAVCAVGAAGHLLLDLASGVGVQLLWPFWVHWSAWGLADNLDLWILVLLVAGLLLPLLFGMVSDEVGEKRGPRGGRAAIVTLVLLGLYLGARANLHSRAIDLLLSREYHGRIALSAGAFPESASPLAWRGVVVTDNTIEEVDVPLDRSGSFDAEQSLTYFKPEESAALDLAEKSGAAARFLAYAQFPLAHVQRVEADYRVEVRDARFAADDTELANVFLRVDFNSRLQIVRERFLYATSPNP